MNLVLFVELTVAFILGLRLGFLTDEATTGKITELGIYTAMQFGAWQWWPQEWVWFAVLPQCAFVVFAEGLGGCTLRWGVERACLVAYRTHLTSFIEISGGQEGRLHELKKQRDKNPDAMTAKNPNFFWGIRLVIA